MPEDGVVKDKLEVRNDTLEDVGIVSAAPVEFMLEAT